MIGKAALQIREVFGNIGAKKIPKEDPRAVLVEAPNSMPSVTPTPTPIPRKIGPKSRHRPSGISKVERIWLLDHETPPPSRPTPHEHAVRLLRWLRSAGFSGTLVLAQDLQRIYPAMCAALGWETYPWQTVAHALRRLTGGRKIYKWAEGRRLCVYHIVRAATMTKSPRR